MASTTTAKKEIIDFLWEWAETKGDWGKLLIDKLVKTEQALSLIDRQEVFDYFIDSLRTVKKMPAITLKKPVFSATNKIVQLSSLSNISGVNRLAKNQQMDFSKNITVIYGENGTGKTGYGRILKSFGFSYDLHNTIHSNIFASVKERKSAMIDFTLNGNAESFNWDGMNNHPALTNISVFNNSCVQISLGDRRLIVAPIGFHLFNIVTSELGELSSLLQQKKVAYPITVVCEPQLNIGTPQHTFITTLSDKSTEQKLKEVSDLPLDIVADIELQEKKLLGLNQQLIQSEIRELTNQISELNALVLKIKSAAAKLGEVQWKRLIQIHVEVDVLSKKTKIGLKQIAENNDISYYDTAEFKTFLISAENYITLMEQPYPGQEDSCIYCKQPLNDSARKLLVSYKNLLNDTTEGDLKKLILERAGLIDSVSQINDSYILNLGSFGSDEQNKPVQPAGLTKFNEDIKKHKSSFVQNAVVQTELFGVDYETIIKVLEEQALRLENISKEKTEQLHTIAELVVAVQSTINELKDRKLLSDNLAAIKTAMLNRKNLAKLDSKANEFSTNSISRKTSEAREELISQNFDSMFQNELKSLRKSHLKIDLSFGTERGSSKIIQKINQYTLTDILSEGEQKAIALAEFLTELHLDNTKAPVVFDDPVNSLDHQLIDEVAKRLIALSKTRQVIIFTHSILLLNSFIQQSELDTSKQEDIDFKFYSVKNNFDDTGILDEVEELNSYSYYTTKLNKVLQCLDKSKSEDLLAAEGYGHLRAAIEVCVEEDILKRIIKRYRKGVAFPSLLRIEGGKIDTMKGELNDIYEKCCVSIVGHSSPSEVHVAPTIAGLKVDFESFKKIRTAFNK